MNPKEEEIDIMDWCKPTGLTAKDLEGAVCLHESVIQPGESVEDFNARHKREADAAYEAMAQEKGWPIKGA